jgi:hypothetical protein
VTDDKFAFSTGLAIGFSLGLVLTVLAYHFGVFKP